MNMRNFFDAYITSGPHSLSRELSRQKESIILEQLNELISRGLLVVEQEEPVLVVPPDSSSVEVRQKVRLRLRDAEYIEQLETEINLLRSKLTTIKDSIGSVFSDDLGASD